MNGDRRVISRSPGVLKACFILMTAGMNSPRPTSALARPMSWKPSLVKFQPSWQLEHCALVLKVTKPRLASSEMAFSLPSIQRSNGASSETTVRS